MAAPDCLHHRPMPGRQHRKTAGNRSPGRATAHHDSRRNPIANEDVLERDIVNTRATPQAPSKAHPAPKDMIITSADNHLVNVQRGNTPKTILPPIKAGTLPSAASNGSTRAAQPAAADFMLPTKDKIDGLDVVVYGNPKSYDKLDFAQGYAVWGFRGTCGEASVANLLTIAGQYVSEKDVIEKAIANGWCDVSTDNPNFRGGTMVEDQRKLLDSYGVATGVLNDFNPEKIATLVKQGKGVLLGVNNLELWGATQPRQFRDLVGINHVVNITGVAYSANTGALQGFYIADSGRGRPSDKARFLSLDELDKVAHFQFGCDVTYTLSPIKPLHGIPDPTLAAPSTPQRDRADGQEVLIYGNPKAYRNLNFRQGAGVTGYQDTAGEVCIANISVLAGRPVSEKEVVERAIKENLCVTSGKKSDPRGGTTAEQQLALLKDFGFDSTLEKGFDEAAVARHIIEGKGVIVSVNSDVLGCATFPKNMGRTDHVVTVTGAAYSADTGDIVGFYIANTVRGAEVDACRFVSLQKMRDSTNMAGSVTITTNDAIKLRGASGKTAFPGPANLNLPGAVATPGIAKPTLVGPKESPSQANVARYLDTFIPPAPFGDDAGTLKKLPGAAVRKTVAIDADGKDLNLGEDHLNGVGNFQGNRIVGNDRDNILDGLGGADTLIGGKGNDSYYVDNAGDKVVEQPGEGVDTVYATVSTRLSANVENLVLLDASKPQSAVVNGVNVLVYGMPKSYLLDYAQGDAVPGYRGTCGDTSVANLTMLGGRPASEKEVVERAIKEHLCDTTDMSPDQRGGMMPWQELTLLKEFGFASTQQQGFDPNAVAQSIKDGKGVGLGVNAGRLWNSYSLDDMESDHCITVTGVACSAASGEVVGFYIADSGRELASDMSRFVTVPQLRHATDVVGADTITTDEPIKLRNQNLNAVGNELGNVLVGNRGDNVLTGGRGNDLLVGGTGNDTYLFAKGDGQDVVYDHDATKGNIDTFKFSDARQTDLRFSHSGNDLMIKVKGSTDQVTIKDWYLGGASGTDNHIERIKTADGKTLYDTDVEKLVQAMASFSVPSATQTSWPTTPGSNGKVLLTVPH
nr:calcium-binding protein [Herbaspirillum sp. ASV7]